MNSTILLLRRSSSSAAVISRTTIQPTSYRQSLQFRWLPQQQQHYRHPCHGSSFCQQRGFISSSSVAFQKRQPPNSSSVFTTTITPLSSSLSSSTSTSSFRMDANRWNNATTINGRSFSDATTAPATNETKTTTAAKAKPKKVAKKGTTVKPKSAKTTTPLSSSSSSPSSQPQPLLGTLPPDLERGPLYQKLSAWYQKHHQLSLEEAGVWLYQPHSIAASSATAAAAISKPTHFAMTLICPMTLRMFPSGTLRTTSSSTSSSSSSSKTGDDDQVPAAAVTEGQEEGAATITINRKKRPNKKKDPIAIVAPTFTDHNVSTTTTPTDSSTTITPLTTATIMAYPSLTMAVEAACARALDVHRFQQTGILEPRQCEEHPRDVMLSVFSQPLNDDEAATSTPGTIALTNMTTTTTTTTTTAQQSAQQTADTVDKPAPKRKRSPKTALSSSPATQPQEPILQVQASPDAPLHSTSTDTALTPVPKEMAAIEEATSTEAATTATAEQIAKVVVDGDEEFVVIVKPNTGGIASIFSAVAPTKFQRQQSPKKDVRLPPSYQKDKILVDEKPLSSAVPQMVPTTATIPATAMEVLLAEPVVGDLEASSSSQPFQQESLPEDNVAISTSSAEASKKAPTKSPSKKRVKQPITAVNVRQQPAKQKGKLLKQKRQDDGTLTITASSSSKSVQSVSNPIGYEALPVLPPLGPDTKEHAAFAPTASTSTGMLHSKSPLEGIIQQMAVDANHSTREHNEGPHVNGHIDSKPSSSIMSAFSKIPPTESQAQYKLTQPQPPDAASLSSHPTVTAEDEMELVVAKHSTSSGISSFFTIVAPTEFQYPPVPSSKEKPSHDVDDDSAIHQSFSALANVQEVEVPQSPVILDATKLVPEEETSEFIVKPSLGIASVFAKVAKTEFQQQPMPPPPNEAIVAPATEQGQDADEFVRKPSSGISSVFAQVGRTEFQQQSPSSTFTEIARTDGVGEDDLVVNPASGISSLFAQAETQTLPQPNSLPIFTSKAPSPWTPTSLQTFEYPAVASPSSPLVGGGSAIPAKLPQQVQQSVQPPHNAFDKYGIAQSEDVSSFLSTLPEAAQNRSYPEQESTIIDGQEFTLRMPSHISPSTAQSVNGTREDTEIYSMRLKRSSVSTLSHIMDAWVDNINFRPESLMDDSQSLRLPISEAPLQADDVVTRIDTWFRNLPDDSNRPKHIDHNIRKSRSRVYNEREDDDEVPATFTTSHLSRSIAFTSSAANRALSALASTTPDNHATNNLPISRLSERVEEAFSSQVTRDYEIAARKEKIATQLLERMWASASSSADLPTVETYNAYLKCIHDPSNHGAAKRATEILNLMQSNQSDKSGRLLPLPNVDTLNAVLQHWARVNDQTTRREGIEDLFERFIQNRDSGIIPNRETFVTILSSEVEDGFDTEFARKWIDVITQLSEEHPWLEPDSQVWNAPLRWSGVRDRETWGEHPQASWDNHLNIFQSGFKTDGVDDCLTQQAQKMVTWLEVMKGYNHELPTIETYESLIQAFVRTGTRSGLNQAEFWAKQVIDSASALKPRLATFHPIIAAWMYCGDVEGPDKVLEWINRLDSLGGQSLPDGRVRGAYIFAITSVQRTTMNALQERGGDELTERRLLAESVRQGARKCTQYLEALCNELHHNKNDIILDASLFREVINAWTRNVVAFDRAGTPEVEGIDEAAAALVQTMNQLEALVRRLQLPNETDTSAVNDQQCRHLMLSANGVLDAYLQSLMTIDRCRQKLPEWDKSETLVLRHLFQTEKFIRRCNELYRIYCKTQGRGGESSARKRSADEVLNYCDGYYYVVPHVSKISNRAAIYTRFFSNFELIRPPPLPGDLVRISFQVTDSANWWEERHREGLNKMYQSQTRLLDHLITNKEELRLIRGQMNVEDNRAGEVAPSTRYAPHKPLRRIPRANILQKSGFQVKHKPRTRAAYVGS